MRALLPMLVLLPFLHSLRSPSRSCFIDSPSGTLILSTWEHVVLRPHRRDESWSASLWQTFFSTSMGAQIPVIAEKPIASCGCRRFQLDALDDHLCTVVPLTRVTRRLTTGRLINLLTFFAQRIRLKHNRWLKTGVSIVVTSS
jgi:hypothetical protein